MPLLKERKNILRHRLLISADEEATSVTSAVSPEDEARLLKGEDGQLPRSLSQHELDRFDIEARRLAFSCNCQLRLFLL